MGFRANDAAVIFDGLEGGCLGSYCDFVSPAVVLYLAFMATILVGSHGHIFIRRARFLSPVHLFLFVFFLMSNTVPIF